MEGRFAGSPTKRKKSNDCGKFQGGCLVRNMTLLVEKLEERHMFGIDEVSKERREGER